MTYTLNQIGDEFNETFKPGKTIGVPALPSPENAERLFTLLDEEVKELKEAYVNRDLGNFLQEATDIIYVLTTELRLLSLPLDGSVSEVHRANLSKLDDNGKPIVRADGKILKGDNYVAPDMESVLRGTEELPEDYVFPEYVQFASGGTILYWDHTWSRYLVDRGCWGIGRWTLCKNLQTGRLCVRGHTVDDEDLIPVTEEEYNEHWDIHGSGTEER